MAKMETDQAVWFDQQDAKSVPESLQTAYNLYVQYPTAHMPSQQQSQPQGQTPAPNQPKLSNKHPVMHLNELKKDLVYDVLKNEAEENDSTTDGAKQGTEMDQTEENKEGETEKKKKKKMQTTYTCTVNVDGDVFTGTAKSQKLAKQEASKYALLKKFNILYVPGYDNIPDDTNIFTGGKRKNPEKQSGGSKAKKQKNPNIPKNALMVLNEKKPGLQYNVTSQSGPVHAPTFVISVEVDGQVFQGTGTSKKTARLSAAQNACKTLNYEYTA